MAAPPPASRRRWLPIGAVLGVIAVIALLRPDRHLPALLDWMARLGPLAPAVFVATYVAGCVLFVPGSVLTLGGGALFGVVKGSLLVSTGATLGAAAAFLLGRYLFRDRVARRVAGDPRFRAIDEAVGREGWRMVLLTRLSPVFPFSVLNYAFGLTRVPFFEYLWASWVGMLPGTLLYVSLGAAAGEVALGTSGDRQRSPAEWALAAVGLVATVAVTVVITRIARNALRQRLDLPS